MNFRFRRWKVQERYWYISNHVYGWSVPIIMTNLVGVKHAITPSIGVSTCWFHRKSICNEHFSHEIYKTIDYRLQATWTS